MVGGESIFCNLLGPRRRNVERQNIRSRVTTHDVSPDGQQGLGREQVLDPVLGIGLCDLNLGDHELDLLLADAAQVPVGGREQSGWESVTRTCYEIVTNIAVLTSVLRNTCPLHGPNLKLQGRAGHSVLRSLLD